jgi:8-oxo-dGTP pyrophosphatase MutT (NUDIX family)
MTMKSISEYSAGGVVYRQSRQPAPSSQLLTATRQQPGAGSRKQINLWLICKHSGYHQWVLPKGIVEDGESPEETAVREVKEETGVTARIIKKIEPDVRYHYTKNGILVNKRVTFYLMEYVSGDIADRSWEMEDAAWLPRGQASKALAFAQERRVLEQGASQRA